MTEKRYELKCHEINSWHIEKDGKVLIFDLLKSDAEILYTELNSLSDENEQLKQREERLLSEIVDFQELLSKNDNVCYDRIINLIDDKLAFLYEAKGDLINEDSYRLGQISFAITVLNELKKELKGDVE